VCHLQCISARRSRSVEVEGSKRCAGADSSTPKNHRSSPAPDLTDSYTRQGTGIVRRVVDFETSGQQSGPPAVRRPQTTLHDARLGRHAAPLAWYVDKHQSVRSVFVDFSKAFYHVDHNILVAKLVALGLPDVIVRWMCAFLRDRRLRVKIGDVFSDWLHLTAGMPQGSYLGPLTFVILIDALQPGCLTTKYVDHTTMSESLDKSAVSSMQSFVDELVQQATETGMNVNGCKTKEILIGSVLRDPPVSVTMSGASQRSSYSACTSPTT